MHESNQLGACDATVTGVDRGTVQVVPFLWPLVCFFDIVTGFTVQMQPTFIAAAFLAAFQQLIVPPRR